MQTIKFLSTIMATALLVAAPVYAQNNSGPPQSSPALTKKEVRAQNRQTEHAVRKALVATKGLNTAGIVILVKNGAVTLDGSVPDSSQIPLAQNAAESAAQGKSVTNKLTIKEPGN